MKDEKTRMLRLKRAVVGTAAFALATVVTVCANGSVRYPGDVTVDQLIDVSDAVLLARYLLEDPTALLSRAGVENADANSDGKVNSEDVIHIIRMVANQIPMTQPGEEPPQVTETTVTTVTETEYIYTETTATEPALPQLTADLEAYPLEVSISVLTGQTPPNEMLTVNYDIGNVTFAIFANDPRETAVAMAYQDNIIGYYLFCEEYTVPEGYRVQEFRDCVGLSDEQKHEDGAGTLYAVLITRKDVRIDFTHLTQKDDLGVFAKLNYYGTNAIRARWGVKPLEWNGDLARIAQNHSTDMATNNFFEHTSSDGTTRKDRMLNAGIDYQYGGENIDYGYVDPFSALNGWFNSLEHRNNLLSEKYTHIGVGFAYGESSEYRYYGTQDFCSFFDY